jgi:hypothetical protein
MGSFRVNQGPTDRENIQRCSITARQKRIPASQSDVFIVSPPGTGGGVVDGPRSPDGRGGGKSSSQNQSRERNTRPRKRKKADPNNGTIP